MSILFSTAYLPPLSYLQKCIENEKIIIEAKEHFVKQTYRNRCYIGGPNGRQSLVIPVIHKNLAELPINEVLISFESPWNKIHWKSIIAAYRNSPFFEYYEEDFKELYSNPPEKLFDFNMKLLNKLFSIFNLKTVVEFTNEYEKEVQLQDFRDSIHPKKITSITKPYHQVFADRNGFLPDLSVIDYLFNEGNRF